MFENIKGRIIQECVQKSFILFPRKIIACIEAGGENFEHCSSSKAFTVPFQYKLSENIILDKFMEVDLISKLFTMTNLF